MSDETPNFKDLLETAQRVQREVQRIQEELAEKAVEGSSGGGMVVARVNGRNQLVSLTIDREIVDPNDIEMLQDLVVAAVNQAQERASEAAQSELGKLGLSVKLPGLG